jgi:putative restriction endonuclease
MTVADELSRRLELWE